MLIIAALAELATMPPIAPASTNASNVLELVIEFQITDT